MSVILGKRSLWREDVNTCFPMTGSQALNSNSTGKLSFFYVDPGTDGHGLERVIYWDNLWALVKCHGISVELFLSIKLEKFLQKSSKTLQIKSLGT